MEENNDSVYGLLFKLVDCNGAELKDKLKNIKDYQWNYNRGQGLARVYRDGGSWDADDENLGDSFGIGRVAWGGVTEEAKKY